MLTIEEIYLENNIDVVDDIYEKVKVDMDWILGLIDSIFQLWTHFQNVPKAHVKNEAIKYWKAEIVE